MPRLSSEMFETPPAVGQEITVKGTVKDIDPETGEVEVTYESVEVSTSESEGGEEVEDTTEMRGDEAFDVYMKSQE